MSPGRAASQQEMQDHHSLVCNQRNLMQCIYDIMSQTKNQINSNESVLTSQDNKIDLSWDVWWSRVAIFSIFRILLQFISRTEHEFYTKSQYSILPLWWWWRWWQWWWCWQCWQWWWWWRCWPITCTCWLPPCYVLSSVQPGHLHSDRKLHFVIVCKL